MSAVISDTSPLRVLQALDQLNLLKALYTRVVVPPAVARELGVPATHVPPLLLASLDFVQVVSPRGELPTWVRGLGRGEAEAIALALEHPGSELIVDDLEARAVSRRMGIRVTGVLGVLVAARKLRYTGPLTPQLAHVERVLNFRISAPLRSQVLRDVGEADSP